MDVRRQMLEYMGTIKPGTSLAIFTLGSGAGRRQGVDVRRLVFVCTVATDAVNTQIIGKDEDDVGL